MDAQTVLTGLGAAFAAYSAAKLLGFTWFHFLRRSSLHRYSHATKSGGSSSSSADQPWALITGASDGIGKGFAEELCSKGFNVVLHGRNAAKLEGVKAELHKAWPQVDIRIAILGADSFTEAAMDEMLEGLRDLHITVLINNVGGWPPVDTVFRPLDTLSFGLIDSVLALNARFATQLTAKLIPRLRQAGPALIINISSIAGTIPSSYLSVYSGVKAFNALWGGSLTYEMYAENSDIEVLSLIVGEVQAQWDRSATHFTRPSARHFARSSLHKVGCGYPIVTPYIGHAMMMGPIGLFPEWLRRRTLVNMARTFKVKEAARKSKAQ